MGRICAWSLDLTQKQLDGLKDILGNFDLWKKNDELAFASSPR